MRITIKSARSNSSNVRQNAQLLDHRFLQDLNGDGLLYRPVWTWIISCLHVQKEQLVIVRVLDSLTQQFVSLNT